MTQEEKQVLLKDLCARLPYGVRVQTDSNPRKMIAMDLWDINSLPKPYLRSMSSMTEEERNLIRKYCDEHDRLIYDIGVSGQVHSKNIVDWLNAHNFDYRGLIEKGLAIEVTKENNPYKD